MKLNFQWMEKTGSYQTGDECFLGKIRVAEYSWNGSRPQGSDGPTWVGQTTLPQLTKSFYNNDKELLKQRLESVIAKWFKEVLQ